MNVGKLRVSITLMNRSDEIPFSSSSVTNRPISVKKELEKIKNASTSANIMAVLRLRFLCARIFFRMTYLSFLSKQNISI